MDNILVNKPKRRRNVSAKYTNKDFCPYFDIDKEDWANLVLKIQRGEDLTKEENTRYGQYILAITQIIVEGPRFRDKPMNEKSDLRDDIYYEILMNVPPHFNPSVGTIYSYSYRIGYTRATHYYTDRAKEVKRMIDSMNDLESYEHERNEQLGKDYYE